MRKFTPAERVVLGIVQDNLPHTLAPFADIAKAAGISEADTLALLRGLKDCGVIRRFGASIRHQRTGWDANAMVAWIASPEEAEICGARAAKYPRISHAYFRPSPASDWPYTFYTMIHGRTDQEFMDLVHELRDSWPLKDYAVLRSIRELKKTSMRYFA